MGSRYRNGWPWVVPDAVAWDGVSYFELAQPNYAAIPPQLQDCGIAIPAAQDGTEVNATGLSPADKYKPAVGAGTLYPFAFPAFKDAQRVAYRVKQWLITGTRPGETFADDGDGGAIGVDTPVDITTDPAQVNHGPFVVEVESDAATQTELPLLAKLQEKSLGFATALYACFSYRYTGGLSDTRTGGVPPNWNLSLFAQNKFFLRLMSIESGLPDNLPPMVKCDGLYYPLCMIDYQGSPASFTYKGNGSGGANNGVVTTGCGVDWDNGADKISMSGSQPAYGSTPALSCEIHMEATEYWGWNGIYDTSTGERS